MSEKEETTETTNEKLLPELNGEVSEDNLAKVKKTFNNYLKKKLQIFMFQSGKKC